MSAPEVVAEHRCRLGEGPVWDRRRDELIFVDILEGEVLRFTPGRGEPRRWRAGEPVSAAIPRRTGGLVLTLGAGVAGLDEAGALIPLVSLPMSSEPGERLNDAKCDPAGRLWAGTQSDRAERRQGRLYRIAADRVPEVALRGVGISNGLDWSPDETTMYYVDTATSGVDAFAYDRSDGTIAARHRWLAFDSGDGLPDGLTVDDEGGIWIALFGGGQLRRYAPDGQLDAVVRFPVSLVTSCAFGGPDLTDLYVTTAAHRLNRPEPLAGALFRLRPGVRGRPANAFAG